MPRDVKKARGDARRRWSGLALLLALTAACAAPNRTADPAERLLALQSAAEAMGLRLRLDVASPEEVPTTGKVRYLGQGSVVLDPPGRQMLLMGDLVLDVDFAAGRVTGRLTDVVGHDVPDGPVQPYTGTVEFSGLSGVLVDTGAPGVQRTPRPFGGLRLNLAGQLESASDPVQIKGTMEAFLHEHRGEVVGFSTRPTRQTIKATLDEGAVQAFVGLMAQSRRAE